MSTMTETSNTTPADEKRADTITHIRQCKVCGCDDPELMAGLADLPDDEVEDYVRTAHVYARYEQRQRYLRRNA